MTNGIIASKIKELRTSLRLTQAEFAESVNTTQAALSGYERGDRTPSLDILYSISRKFNVSVDWLLGRSKIKDLSFDFNTYYDVLNMFVKLCSTKYKDETRNLVAPSIVNSSSNIHFIVRDDPVFNTFFTNWQKMYTLLQENVINTDIYNQWLEGELSQYKDHPRNGIPF